MIDVPEQGSERRWRVSPIVIDPPPKERIETIGNFGQRQLCAMSDAHFPDLCSHGFQCRRADGRVEATEQRLVPCFLNQSWPKAVAEEIKLDVRILSFALSVLAVDDLGFRRMHFQTALCQTCSKRALEGLGFLLVSTVNQPVIGISTPGKVGVCPRYPEIECVMHKQIRKNRTDDTPLRGAARTLHFCPVLAFHWRLQPPFDVQQRPFALHVLSDSPQQEFVVDIVEQTFYVELENPIVSPATLTRDTYGIESRFSRSIAIRVCQKDWIQTRLDQLLHNRLSYAICYGGHTQNPLASRLLGYGDGAHRRRKIAPRAHSVPKLVEITLQVGFELLDCLFVHTGRTMIGFDRFISLVHLLFGNVERFVRRTHRHPPVSSCFDHTTA